MLAAALRSLTRAWDARRGSQRSAWLAMAVAVVIVAAIIVIAIPLREAIVRAKGDVAQRRELLAASRARAAENAALSRAPAPTREPDLHGSIDRVLGERGLRYDVVGERGAAGPLRIVIADASFDALVRALDALMREDGVRATEAVLAARVEPGTVRAELAFAR